DGVMVRPWRIRIVPLSEGRSEPRAEWAVQKTITRSHWYRIFALLLAMSPSLARPAPQTGWIRYADESGTTLDFPRHLFVRASGEPALGTGERFVTEDGRAALSVYVISNDERRSPASYLKAHMSDRPDSLDYIRVAPKFFVTSKYAGDLILYRRCNFSSGTSPLLHCIDLAYPANEKRAWDAPVTRMSGSLRPLK